MTTKASRFALLSIIFGLERSGAFFNSPMCHRLRSDYSYLQASSSSNIVIAGGGVVGTSIAYFLAKRDVPVILVDPVGIAPAASAKAGGLLARDWRDGTALEELQQKGFDLHQELADELGSETIQYRRLTCAAVAVDEDRAVQKPPSRKLKDVEWVDLGVCGSTIMGNEDTIAQVHPKKLCEAMWEFCEKKGSELRVGRVVKAMTDDDRFVGVEMEDGSQIEARKLVVACGPWTEQARTWFRNKKNLLPEVTGIKCHSILVKAPEVFQQAVFFESDGELGDGDLEVYPRPDGDCYVNGFPSEESIVIENPGQEKVEVEDVELLRNAMVQTSTSLGGVEPHTMQACYWPETPDGVPLIGPIPGVEGAFVATGHSVWGILQGPITGKAMAEVLLDGKANSLDLTLFDAKRFN